MANDGSVYIDVNMDVSRAEKNWAKYVKKLQEGNDKIHELQAQIDAFGDVNDEAVGKQIDKLLKQQDAVISDTKAWQMLTDAYREWLDLNKGGGGNANNFTFSPKAENAKYWEDNSRGAGYLNAGGRVSPRGGEREMFDATEYSDLAMGVGEKIKLHLIGALENIADKGLDVAVNIGHAFDMASMNAGNAWRSMSSGAWDQLKNGAVRVGSAIANAMKSAGSAVLTGLHKPLEGVERLVGNITRRFGLMLQNIFFFNIISKAMREISSYMSVVMEKNTQISTALAQLRGALYAMIQPLASAIIPILTQIINFITYIIVAVGRLFSMLTGKSWSASVAGAKSVAGSMGSGAKSAKEMQKYLANFDQINQIGTPDTDTGGGGGGKMPSFDFDTSQFTALDAVFQGIYDWIMQLKEITLEWWATLDFAPLQTAFTNFINAILPLIIMVRDILTWLYENIILPLIGWLIEKALPAVLDLTTAVLNFINTALQPLISGLKTVWEQYLKPIVQWVGDKVVTVLEYVTELVDKFRQSWEENAPTIERIVIGVGNIISWLGRVFQWLIDDIVIPVLQALGLDAESFGDIVGGAFTLFVNAIAWSIEDATWKMNAFLSALEGMVNGAIDNLNVFLNAISAVINAFAGIGGVIGWKADLALPHISIPRLATGAVIPANSPFMAMLGDQKSGTNIEAPLDTIVQAFRMALSEQGTRQQEAVMVVDSTVFARLVYDLNNQEGKRIGVDLVNA